MGVQSLTNGIIDTTTAHGELGAVRPSPSRVPNQRGFQIRGRRRVCPSAAKTVITGRIRPSLAAALCTGHCSAVPPRHTAGMFEFTEMHRVLAVPGDRPAYFVAPGDIGSRVDDLFPAQ